MNTRYRLTSDAGTSYTIGAEGLSIGRSHTNNIVIPDPNISRLHARILYAGDRFWIRDENSKLGTFVNGVLIPGQQELHPGDVLQIGSKTFHLIPVVQAFPQFEVPMDKATPMAPAAIRPARTTSRRSRKTRLIYAGIAGTALLAVVAVIGFRMLGGVQTPPMITMTAPAVITQSGMTPTNTAHVTSTDVPSPSPTPKPIVVVSVPSLNVREGPSTDHNIIGGVKQGDILVVMGQALDCTWLKVSLPNGTIGWVSKQNVSFDLSCNAIPTAPYPTPPSTRIPVSPTQSCSTSEYLDITNDTGGTVTLYLSGPAKFTFYLSPGSNRLAVCPGTYSYTAYGCGGAMETGTLNSGESWTFYCTP